MLKISRSYYYKLVKLKYAISSAFDEAEEARLQARVESIYNASKRMYGCRKIAAMLAKENIHLSPYKVLKIMRNNGLSSLYRKKKRFQPYSNKRSDTTDRVNVLEQHFTQNKVRKMITSDLTYIPFGNSFLYVCFVVDLYNREIIAHGVSDRHDADFVYQTLSSINLKKTEVFHSDRGTEFINQRVEKLLEENGVVRSVSKAGYPYDNAVSENLFGIFKREWMKELYTSIEMLRDDVNDFVNNYNIFRIHSHLNYQSPVEFRLSN
jgi:transposase InsO family protein